MLAISQALRDLLDSGNFDSADLYTITLRSGTVLRYTTGDRSVVYGGETFLHCGPGIERSRISQKIGIEVDELDIEIYPRLTHLVEGVPFVVAVRYGLFDAARVDVHRGFWAAGSAAVVGVVLRFGGEVGEIAAEPGRVEMTVYSLLHRLDVQLPRNLYQAGCQWTLYEMTCGALRESFEVEGQVGAGATASIVPVAALAQADGYFDLGVLELRTGTMMGISCGIRRWLDGAAAVFPPLPRAPDEGDEVVLVPGCDKTRTRCAVFGRLEAWRGFPNIPEPETAV